VTTWTRRCLTAVVFSATLLGAAGGLARADQDRAASGGADPGVSATEVAASPLHPASDGLEPVQPTVGPTDPTTDPPTALPTTDEPGSQTPTPPQDTGITQSVAVAAGEGQQAPLPQPRGPGTGERQAAGASVGGNRPATGLAATGVRVGLPLGIAAALLLAGTGALLAGRKRYTGGNGTTGGRP
jgi:hypothetical protein